VKLDRIGADLPIVQRNGSYFLRLTLVGSDGSRHRFLIRSLIPSEERMVQLFRVLNRMFDKHKESRSRLLAFHTPIIILVWPEVCFDSTQSRQLVNQQC
jgi:transformation/transcription domain-associated protein